MPRSSLSRHLLPHPGPADRVEAGGGLVEEEHLRVVHQGGGEVEPAPHATRVGADVAVDRVADVDEGDEVVDAGVDLGLAEAVEAALEPQQLPTALLGVEGCLLEGDTDPEPHLLGMGGDVVTGDDRAAGSRLQQRAEHADGRRLAGAVRPQEAVDLPFVDLQVEAVDGIAVTERSHQSVGGDGGHVSPHAVIIRDQPGHLVAGFPGVLRDDVS
jgi:hypothetical protein